MFPLFRILSAFYFDIGQPQHAVTACNNRVPFKPVTNLSRDGKEFPS
jgi:hypothetical protein